MEKRTYKYVYNTDTEKALASLHRAAINAMMFFANGGDDEYERTFVTHLCEVADFAKVPAKKK